MIKPPLPRVSLPPNSDPAGIPAEWSWHHRTLLEIHAELLRKHGEREASLRTAIERGGTDQGDAAIEERENTDRLTKLSFAEAELSEIEAALQRIRAGTYGICEVTGKPIARDRLRAVPWTRLSQEAAVLREQSLRAQ